MVVLDICFSPYQSLVKGKAGKLRIQKLSLEGTERFVVEKRLVGEEIRARIEGKRV
jgi:hypothetical protein